jgi:hypothetical protein
MSHDWLLLIYTLPSQPSRKRAYVWRELKKLGAVYLRDGVALVPRQEPLERHMQEIVARIREYEGTVDLLISPQFDQDRETELIAHFGKERGAEYRELYHACVRFLRDVLHEVDSDEFGFPDVSNLESELGRLHRWQEQVKERDYFRVPESQRVQEILAKCDEAFERFTHTASDRNDGSEAQALPSMEDVFERLGGGAGVESTVPPDFPL